jgi:hypothetical protein
MESLKDFLNESTVNEAKNANTFAEHLKRNGGFAVMDNGWNFYYCKLLNDDNFDFTKVPKLKEQLKSEGKFDKVYATCICRTQPGEKIDAACLPLYGDTQKYVTHWFNRDMIECIKTDLADRDLRLKKRLDYFIK